MVYIFHSYSKLTNLPFFPPSLPLFFFFFFFQECRWKPGSQYLVSEILSQLSRTCYSLAELTTRPLPDGADPLHLEVYLSDDEFYQALGMSRDEFYSLQTWKQTDIKKKANLF